VDLRETVQAAVNDAAVAQGATAGLVVTEFVVIAHTSGYGPDGEVSQVVVIPDGGSESRILGLVEHARVRMQADVLDGYREL